MHTYLKRTYACTSYKRTHTIHIDTHIHTHKHIHTHMQYGNGIMVEWSEWSKGTGQPIFVRWGEYSWGTWSERRQCFKDPMVS